MMRKEDNGFFVCPISVQVRYLTFPEAGMFHVGSYFDVLKIRTL